MIGPGTLLQNRYRLVQKIGQGGMGAVYIATDERFNSTVAVKQTFFFDDPTLRKAFEREAHLLNHLRHTALPKVSDHFIEGTGQFLVMEFIEGSDLGQLLHDNASAFPVADVLRWADDLLDALDYLHNHKPQVVHRDIKPQNLKLTTRGQIVLLDFGLAKGTPAQTHASVTGSVLGYSPQYAPLEQVQGTGTDPRSDLYSLGATLYHLMTGVPPVDALTRASAIINNQPDPLRPAHVVNTQVPVAVGIVIQRTMAQKASLRPATATELRDMLRQAVNGRPHAARPSPAAAPFMRGRSATNEATVVEPLAPSADKLQSSPYGETTVEGAAYRGARSPVTSQAVTSFQLPPVQPARKSPAKMMIAAAVLVVCAITGFAFALRSPSVKIEAQTATSPDATAGTSPAALDTKQAEATGENPQTASPTETPRSQTQTADAPAASGAPNASSPSAPVASETGAATSNGASNAGSGGNATPASGAQTESGQGLVIQRPAPSPQPQDSTSAVDDVVRRAEEFRKRQAQPPPPGGGYPPPRRPPPF